MFTVSGLFRYSVFTSTQIGSISSQSIYFCVTVHLSSQSVALPSLHRNFCLLSLLITSKVQQWISKRTRVYSSIDLFNLSKRYYFCQHYLISTHTKPIYLIHTTPIYLTHTKPIYFKVLHFYSLIFAYFLWDCPKKLERSAILGYLVWWVAN